MEWRDANHALLFGHVMGALARLAEFPPTQVEPVLDDDGFTNVIRITRPSGSYLVTVEPDFGQAQPTRPC